MRQKANGLGPKFSLFPGAETLKLPAEDFVLGDNFNHFQLEKREPPKMMGTANDAHKA
jgi:hypothetical protein